VPFIRYYLPDQIRSMILAEYVACVGEIRTAYTILVGKSQRKRERGMGR
jgi:hypothetical protein